MNSTATCNGGCGFTCNLGYRLVAGQCELIVPAWTQRSPLSAPQPRKEHGMAYDFNRRRILLFGGVNASGTLLNDTWEWTGFNWQLVTTTASPGPRSAHAMGTVGAAAYVSGGIRTFGADSDLWRFTGSNWTLLTMNPSPVLTPRSDHALAQDVGSGNVLVHGGAATGLSGSTHAYSALFDLWSLQGASTPVRGHTLTFDPMANRVLRFAGETDAGVSSTLEAWSGAMWSPLTSGTVPARTQHSMVYDPTRGVFVVFGGRGATYFGDTWELSGTTFTAPTLTAAPSPRASHAMAFDVDGGFGVLFGGEAPDGGVLGDTWVYGP